MELELNKGLVLFLQIFWSKLSTILFLCCLFSSNAQRTFVAVQFLHPMTKITQFGSSSFVCCSFSSNAPRKFVALQFLHPTYKSHSSWLGNEENIGKCLCDVWWWEILPYSLLCHCEYYSVLSWGWERLCQQAIVVAALFNIDIEFNLVFHFGEEFNSLVKRCRTFVNRFSIINK